MASGGRPKSRRRSQSFTQPRDTGLPISFDTTPLIERAMDSDSGSSANKLQHDIERLQREIRMLSASKSVSRRSEIRRELADHDNSMAEYGWKGTGRSQAAENRPPRTADPRRRGESVSLNSGVSANRQSNGLKIDFSVGDTEGVPATAATMCRRVWREGS